MAHLLKKYGYDNVTVIEKMGEVGGKSHSVFLPEQKEVPQEVGTCFMHPGYHRMVKLLDDYGISYHKTGGETYGSGSLKVFFFFFFFPDPCFDQLEYTIYSPDLNKKRKHPENEPSQVGPWILADVEILTTNKLCWCLPPALQIITVELTVHRYINLHRKIFGKYEYPLPPRPTPEMMDMIDMTFMKFIQIHKLEPLIPFFLLGTSAQGYGLLETTPALYGLWWNTPDFAASLINPSPLACVVPAGFQNVWKKIAETDHLKILRDTTVTSINRNLFTPEEAIAIETASASGETGIITADFLIVTTPLKQTFERIVKDTTETEKDLFGRQKAASIVTTIYGSDVKDPNEQATTYYPERLDEEHAGRFYAERNSERAAFPDNKFSATKRVAVTYQYYVDAVEDLPDSDERAKLIEEKKAKAKATLEEDLKSAGHQGVEVIHQYYWDYFPRYSREDIRRLYPWKILEHQGTSRTWYAGSSACFESVEDVVSYNHLLLQTFRIEDNPVPDQQKH